MNYEKRKSANQSVSEYDKEQIIDKINLFVDEKQNELECTVCDQLFSTIAYKNKHLYIQRCFFIMRLSLIV